jgi:hypothetical protein
MLLFRLQDRSISNIAGKTMRKLYVRKMLAGTARWQLTCAEVWSEAEVDYQMDAHVEQSKQSQMIARRFIGTTFVQASPAGSCLQVWTVVCAWVFSHAQHFLVKRGSQQFNACHACVDAVVLGPSEARIS